MHRQLHAPCRPSKSQLNPSKRRVLRYWSAVICFPGVGGGREGRPASGVSEARFPLWPGKSHATLINEHHDYRITPSALAHTTAIRIKPSNTFGSCCCLPAVMYLMAVNEQLQCVLRCEKHSVTRCPCGNASARCLFCLQSCLNIKQGHFSSHNEATMHSPTSAHLHITL